MHGWQNGLKTRQHRSKEMPKQVRTQNNEKAACRRLVELGPEGDRIVASIPLASFLIPKQCKNLGRLRYRRRMKAETSRRFRYCRLQPGPFGSPFGLG